VSDMSEGPGWWIASDDKWYPPHLHPSVRLPDTPSSEQQPERTATMAGWSGPDSPDARPPSDSSPGIAGFPPDAGPAPKRGRRPLAAALSLVVVLVVVVGAVTIFGGSQSASAKVANAVTTSLNDRTAHVTMTLTGTVVGANVTGTGSGGIDFTNNAEQLQMTVGADGKQEPINAVYLGGVVYESLPGLSTLVPGKSWLSIDLSALKKEEAQDPSAGSLGSNPAVMLQMLAQQGNTVVPLGPSTVDGTAVDGYSVTMDTSRVAQQIKKANLPAWMQQAVSGLKVHDAHVKVYVDHSGLLRSMVNQVSESTSLAGNASFTETLDFSDYGTPVTVTAPPASQVESFEQLLQAAGTQGSSTSS
jgi:hypothetical protein